MTIGMGHNSSGARQSILRSNPESGFTRISNALLQDARVSYETRGLLAELLSRPDDWQITVVAIVKSGPAGRDKVYRMLREAEKFGYASTRKDRNEDGSFNKHAYVVTDDPKLLIERAAEEIARLEAPLPEKAEVVVPFPSKTEAENGRKQATSGNSVSGDPLPENPLPAKPLTANPQHTNKRYIQTTTTQNSAGAMRAAAVGLATAMGAMPAAAAAQQEPPAIIQPAKPSLKELSDKLFEAGGNALNRTTAGLEIMSTPKRWVDAGCDLELDILPTVKALAVRRAPQSVSSWKFFDAAVFDAKAARTAPVPEGRAAPLLRPNYPPRKKTKEEMTLDELRDHYERGGV